MNRINNNILWTTIFIILIFSCQVQGTGKNMFSNIYSKKVEENSLSSTFSLDEAFAIRPSMMVSKVNNNSNADSFNSYSNYNNTISDDCLNDIIIYTNRLLIKSICSYCSLINSPSATKCALCEKDNPKKSNIEVSKKEALEVAFLYLAGKGDLEKLKLLKNKGVNIRAVDGNGRNALHYASYLSNSVEPVKWLIDEVNIDIETKGKFQRTPLLCAARKGQLKLLELLKNKGSDITAIDKGGDNALHLACFYTNNVETVNWLIDEVNIDIETRGFNQLTPFLCAAYKGQLEILKLLRNKGADITAIDKYGNNALHLACKFSNSVETVNWLIDKANMDIETRGFNQLTPFLCATDKGQLKVLELLKNKGADITAIDKNGDSALHLACGFSNSIETVNWLIDKANIDIETKGKYQRTPFLKAAYEGQLDILKLLRNKGADITAIDEDGDSALHLACGFSNSIETVNWLIDKANIDIETKGEYQRTPFLCAADNGQLEILKLLRDKGADITAVDEDGDSALHLACYFSKNIKIIEWLINSAKIEGNEIGNRECRQ